ncbi:restriction endonuclease subunit S [Leeuwenhoekiella sp. A16]|uniref:restriction endonuclease subunit S n=1 Tax=Leeuwenhoekiella sp. A16 TaxID=3141462 RepID=UPI003A7FDCB9
MKLNDVCEVITCGVAKRPNYVEDGIPFLSSKNVKEDRFILDSYNYVSKEDYLKLTKHNKPEKGDILYTRVGSFGQAAVVNFDFEFAVFVSLTLIKPKKEIVDSRYLMHYLNNPFIRNLANNSTSGIGVQNLNVKVVREFPIDLPPLKTQQHITTILDDAAALRDKTAQLLTEYDLLSQSIFLEMFGDPVRNQKNWNIKPISEISKRIQIGPFGSQLHKSDYQDLGFSLVNPIDIKNGEIDLENCKKIGENKFLSLPNYHLQRGDLIIARRGDLSKIAVVENEDLFCGTGSLYVRFNEKLNSKFCSYFFNQEVTISRLYEEARGITMANLNKTIIKEFNIPVPPIELQNQFADKIALIEQQKALAKQELQESEDLFNCLLQKAFKGELTL